MLTCSGAASATGAAVGSGVGSGGAAGVGAGVAVGFGVGVADGVGLGVAVGAAVGSGVAVLSAAGADTADGLLSAKTSAEFAGAEQAVSIRTARANIHFFIRIPHILYRQVYRAVAAASRIPPAQNKSCGTP